MLDSSRTAEGLPNWKSEAALTIADHRAGTNNIETDEEGEARN